MDGKVVLRTGKYSGKTVEWVLENNPSYIEWVQENRPEMLKAVKPKTESTVSKNSVSDNSNKTMTPNMNFWNEGPDIRSIEYLNKNKNELDGK